MPTLLTPSTIRLPRPPRRSLTTALLALLAMLLSVADGSLNMLPPPPTGTIPCGGNAIAAAPPPDGR
uniref:Putative secreted protein n=1 Tax=Anopheles darlingi TaxID=43151 RepID=A0A2M4DMC0_ANODA